MFEPLTIEKDDLQSVMTRVNTLTNVLTALALPIRGEIRDGAVRFDATSQGDQQFSAHHFPVEKP